MALSISICLYNTYKHLEFPFADSGWRRVRDVQASVASWLRSAYIYIYIYIYLCSEPLTRLIDRQIERKLDR